VFRFDLLFGRVFNQKKKEYSNETITRSISFLCFNHTINFIHENAARKPVKNHTVMPKIVYYADSRCLY